MKAIKWTLICLFIVFCYTSVFADYSVTVYTPAPKNSPVQVIVRTVELTPTRKAELDAWVTRNYPNAKKLRDATNNYNCHSYAWYNTSASNTYWMNDPTKFMTDGSYTQKSAPVVGYKIFYNGSTMDNWHSGIFISITKVQSKWGPAGLYEHGTLDTPYGRDVKYFTR